MTNHGASEGVTETRATQCTMWMRLTLLVVPFQPLAAVEGEAARVAANLGMIGKQVLPDCD